MALGIDELRRRQSEGGKVGGAKKVKTKGFGSDKERARLAGKKGAEARWKKEQ